MAINWQTFSTDPTQNAALYNAALYNFFIKVETQNHQTPDYSAYDDGAGNVTIGVGFNLGDLNVRTEVFNVLGLVQNDPRLSPSLQTIENQYIQQLIDAINAHDAYQFNTIMVQRAANTSLTAVLGPLSSQLDDTQVQNIFAAIIPTYESDVNTWLAGIPDSQERIALVSLAYNAKVGTNGLPTTLGPKLGADIQNGDRAEAWYQIRYNSDYEPPNLATGIAKRRYYESQVFGLYDNPNSLTVEDAAQVYQMFSLHRGTILAYEQHFGGEVAAANSDYQLTGSNQVQTLTQSLDPAAGVIVQTLQSQYAILAHVDLSAFEGTDATNIFLNPGRASSSDPVSSAYAATLDASYSAAATGPNLLIASTGGPGGLTPDTGNDLLVASASGNDLLIAGAGQDSLYAGFGADTLIGGAGNDTLYAGSGADTFDYASFSDTGIETIVLPDPSGSGSALGSVEVGASALTGGAASQTAPFTWTGNSTSYVFTPGAGNPGVGTLTVSGGALGTGGGEIVLQNFNLNAAMSGTGELGIALGSPVALSAGATDPFLSGDYAPPSVTTNVAAGGVAQTVTIDLAGASATARLVTLGFMGHSKAKGSAMRLPALLFAATLSAIPAAAAAGMPSYHFDLTKGAGIPVCEAFLKRLDTTPYANPPYTYAKPPYCGLPEATTVPGFTPLHRVPLTTAQANALFPRVGDFMATQQQRTEKAYALERAKEWALTKRLMKTLGDTKMPTPDPLISTKPFLRDGSLVAWRYDPPIDIENNGKPDDVLVWQGLGIAQIQGAVCGQPVQTSHFETDGRVPQVAFILTRSSNPLNASIDIAKTKAVFGYPEGYQHPGQPFPDRRFRPLGPTIGIFKYRNLYYIDTFLFDHPIHWWGFLTHSPYNPQRANTLAVFLRRNGHTKQMCEYRMNEAK